MPTPEAVQEARREMDICNACRYCEGYCAVFPAMELRRDFSDADLNYLANLCHNCGGCFYSCQYAPPHEFAINVPKTLAQVRDGSYARYAWPRPMGALFRRNGLIVALVMAGAMAGVLLLAMVLQAPGILYGTHAGEGAFYAVVPYHVMLWLGLATFGYSILAITMSVARFWRDCGNGGRAVGFPAALRALRDILTLRNLGGGGHGCNDRDESFSQVRRWLHHATFYGFLACFAATCVATIYHHGFGWVAPYPFFSIPVALGTLGGLGLMVGTTGLLVVNRTRDPEPNPRELRGASAALIVLLGVTALTGLGLLALRATAAMGVVLAIHLGAVLALFLVLPYSKFVHGAYRMAALLRHAAEQGEQSQVSSD